MGCDYRSVVLLLLLYCRDVSRWQLAQLCYQTALKLQKDPAVQVKPTDAAQSPAAPAPTEFRTTYMAVITLSASLQSTAQPQP